MNRKCVKFTQPHDIYIIKKDVLITILPILEYSGTPPYNYGKNKVTPVNEKNKKSNIAQSVSIKTPLI